MEIWKDILNYEEFYEVSNLGRIRRKEGYVNSGIKHNTQRKVKSYVLKQNKKRSGYLTVDLSKNNVVKTISVHRIVAIAFCENPYNKKEVNHINGIKTDTRAENLEWSTPSENIKHAFDIGLKKGRGKKIRCKQLDMIFNSSYEAAEYINNKYFQNSKQVKSMAAKIRSACLGLQKIAYGFTWEYYI